MEESQTVHSHVVEPESQPAFEFYFKFSFEFTTRSLNRNSSEDSLYDEDYDNYSRSLNDSRSPSRLSVEEDSGVEEELITRTMADSNVRGDADRADGEENAQPEGHRGGGDGAVPDSSQDGRYTWSRVADLMMERKVDTALWAVRFITIILCILYLIPIPLFGSPVNLYYKALISNAATSALRLHQRVPHVTFSRMFLAQLLLEDSCHYLFYSLLFIYAAPISLALVPILLFAALHYASFSLTILEHLTTNTGWLGRVFVNIIQYQTVSLLRVIAGAEILTMIFTVVYTFIGRASFVTPFIYYRFLTLRYASRRNHYSRVMFAEFRMQLEHLAYSPKCPGFIRTVIRKIIDTVSRFAPEIPPAN